MVVVLHFAPGRANPQCVTHVLNEYNSLTSVSLRCTRESQRSTDEINMGSLREPSRPSSTHPVEAYGLDGKVAVLDGSIAVNHPDFTDSQSASCPGESAVNVFNLIAGRVQAHRGVAARLVARNGLN